MTNEQIHELLPFRANGTLTGADLAAVDAALAEDAELRAELAALTAIRDTMRAEDAQSPGDFGLARLMRDVEAAGRVAETPPVANDNVVPLMRLRVWQAAAAVVLAVGIGFNLPQFGPGQQPEAVETAAPEAREGYSLASGGAAGDADFTIAFAPDATELDIRLLLLDAGLEIVSGPSALGLYGVVLLDSGAGDAAREALLASDIVEDVQ